VRIAMPCYDTDTDDDDAIEPQDCPVQVGDAFPCGGEVLIVVAIRERADRLFEVLVRRPTP
jgi:hypothetical protein